MTLPCDLMEIVDVAIFISTGSIELDPYGKKETTMVEYNLVKTMYDLDPDSFKTYFRMNQETFDEKVHFSKNKISDYLEVITLRPVARF